MLTLLHISDLHFGPPYLPARGRGRAALGRRAARRHHRGQRRFHAARQGEPVCRGAGISRTDCPPCPSWSCPAITTCRCTACSSASSIHMPTIRSTFRRSSTPCWRRDDAVIVSLNTTSPLSTIMERPDQSLAARLLRPALSQQAPAGAARIVVAHHHFAPAPDYDDQHDVMCRAREALDRFNEPGRGADPGRPLAPGLHRQFAGHLSQQDAAQRNRHRAMRHDHLAPRPGARAREELVQPGSRSGRPDSRDHALYVLQRPGRVRPGQPAHVVSTGGHGAWSKTDDESRPVNWHDETHVAVPACWCRCRANRCSRSFPTRPTWRGSLRRPWVFACASRPAAMSAGVEIGYRIRVFGFPLGWRSLIERWDPPRAVRRRATARAVQVVEPHPRFEAAVRRHADRRHSRVRIAALAPGRSAASAGAAAVGYDLRLSAAKRRWTSSARSRVSGRPVLSAARRCRAVRPAVARPPHAWSSVRCSITMCSVGILQIREPLVGDVRVCAGRYS